MSRNIKERLKNKLVILSATLASTNALATDGFDKLDDTLNSTATGLATLAVATITLATIWVGYKVIFDGKSLADMKNVMIGAALIAGATGFGALWAA